MPQKDERCKWVGHLGIVSLFNGEVLEVERESRKNRRERDMLYCIGKLDCGETVSIPERKHAAVSHQKARQS
jgi:hypothetical protein